MSYKVFVILLCLGITIVLAGITLICSMNQEKIGFKVLLIGGVMAGVGLVGIVYLLFGIVPAIIAGLACVLYANSIARIIEIRFAILISTSARRSR